MSWCVSDNQQMYGRRFYNLAIAPEQVLNNFGIDWIQKSSLSVSPLIRSQVKGECHEEKSFCIRWGC